MREVLELPEVLTLEEAAVFLRIAEVTLRGLIRRSLVPYSRVGRLYRFRRSTLVDWMAGQERESGWRTV